MPLADLAKNFSTTPQYLDDGREGVRHNLVADTRRPAETMDQMEDFESIRPPYIHVRNSPAQVLLTMS